MKKTLAILLTAVMLCGSLAGCSPKTDNSTTESSTASSKDSSQASTASKEPAIATPSWKTDTSPIKLTWLTLLDCTFDPVGNVADKDIMDQTGVTIEFNYGDADKFNVLISTGELLDIVTVDKGSSNQLAIENNGLAAPLDKLRADFAPDFPVPQSMMDWYRNKDGNWYAFTNYYYDLTDPVGKGAIIESHNINYARRDIMEQLNITAESMQTKAGYLDALQKVKDAKIEYNGVIMEPHLGMEPYYLVDQLGIDKEDKNGNWVNEKRTPEYKEAVLFCNEMYRRGLVTDEVFTIDGTLRKQKMASGAVFASTGTPLSNGRNDLYNADKKALMISTGPIKGDNGKDVVYRPTPMGGWLATLISSKCKTPDRAVQLLSYLAQEERIADYHFAGLGGYDIVDGKAVMKAERLAENDKDPAAFFAKYNSSAVQHMINPAFFQKYLPTPTSEKDILDAEASKKYFKTFYDDKVFDNTLPESNTETAIILTQIEAYWYQQYPEIARSKTPEACSAAYDEAIAKMDAMGMAKCDEYQNTRFQENKKKLGIKFAWPRNN